MGRDADERPPIEILGADLGVTSTQQVAVGPKRSGPSRKRLLVMAAVVLVVLVGGAVLGSDDDAEPTSDREADESDESAASERSTTSERDTTTASTTTTTAPIGPPLGGVPVEGALVIGGGARWRVVDLATGDIEDIELPAADPYSSVAIGGGLVTPVSGQARYYPILDRTEDVEPLDLGPADLVLRAGPDRIWLLDTPDEGEDTRTPQTTARLVDLDGVIHATVDVPGLWVSEATPDAILLSRGGRVYAADEDGLRPIAVGSVHGAIGDAAVVLTCDDEGSCALVRQPLDGSEGRELISVSEPDTAYFEAIDAPDGRLALTQGDPTFPGDMLIFAADGDQLGAVTVGFTTLVSPPQWLPGDLGLAIHRGRRVDWVRPEGDGWEVVPLDLEIGGRFSDEVMFVVAP